MPKINPHIAAMGEAATVALADRVRRLRAAGRTIIALQTGDPDFPTPLGIVEAAARAMRDGDTHYCDSRGLPELRQAIADKLQRVNGLAYDPEREILVTCGGIHAYYCALQGLVAPDAEVLIPDPIWMTHTNIAQVLGRRVVRVPSRAEDKWWPTLETWARAVTPRSAALVLNSPGNPTGSVAPREYLEAVSQFAARHDLWVISDEVYENILYEGRTHVPFAGLPGAKARTILMNSFSKTYAMTGWRIGYLAAPAEVISQALKASQNSITNVAPFLQKAATFALGDAEVQKESAQMAQAYARRRNLVLSVASGYPRTPIGITPPQGAFYFFFDVRSLGGTSLEIAEQLLEEAGLSVVPGSAYGACGEGFLRMTIAASDEDVEAGMRALLEWAGSRVRQETAAAPQRV